jgi:hypothetical protein
MGTGNRIVTPRLGRIWHRANVCHGMSHPRFAALCRDAAPLLQAIKNDVATYHKNMM